MIFDQPTDESPPEPYATSPGGMLRIERSEQPGGIVLLALAGELDIESGATLIDVLSDVEDAGVIIDLTALEFIDSTGLNVLLKARSQAEAESRQFVLANLHRNVDRLFKLTGMTSQFTIAA